MKLSDDFAAGIANPAAGSSHNSPGSDLKSESGESAGGATRGRAGETNGADAAAPKDGLIEALLLFVQEVFASGSSVIEVYKDRMRLSVRRTFVRIALGAAALVCAVCWLGASALAVLRGILGAFTALFGGRLWLGELTGGLFALTLTTLAGWGFLKFSSRRELAQLSAKYQRIRDEHGNH